LNKYLVKLASKLEPTQGSVKDPNQWKKDAFGVGTLMAAGGVGTVAADAMKSKGWLGKAPGKWKIGALGAGLGAIGDYAGLKLNHAFNKKIDENAA
jgi:hypothetical protein